MAEKSGSLEVLRQQAWDDIALHLEHLERIAETGPATEEDWALTRKSLYLVLGELRRTRFRRGQLAIRSNEQRKAGQNG